MKKWHGSVQRAFLSQLSGLRIHHPPLPTMSAYRTLLAASNPRARITTLPRSAMAARHYSSPIKVFVDTIKEQMKKNKELQEGVKSLQDESGKLAESDALKKAKEMYEKARVCIVLYSLFL